MDDPPEKVSVSALKPKETPNRLLAKVRSPFPKNPYFMKLNLREACHLIELRTIPQGHVDYRRVAQEMYKQINKVHPNLSKIMNFVDLKEYDLERFEAEKRTEEKRKNR